MSSVGGVRAGGAFVEIFAKDGAFQQAMGRVQARLRAVGASMQQLGTKLMLGGTAVGLPLVLAARQAASFEDALLGMRAAAGLSAKDVKRLEEEALRLSRSMGVAPAAVANAMLELAKAGMSIEDVLAGAAESAVQFARVSGVDMADAAVFMKVAMNSFGVSAVEAVDTLSAAADASETSIAAMVESFALVGSAGALFNQSLFDISQGLAILARYGIRGEEAGTGIKTMLVRLTSPSKEAADALAQIGLSMSDFRDAQGKLLPVVQIVGVLEKALVGVNEQTRDDILGRVFGDRGIRVIGAFLKVGTAGFTTMADAMESNLPVAAKFQIVMSGITGAFERIGAAVQRLSISFAKALGDSASSAVSALTWLMDAMGMLIERFPLAAKLVAGVTAAVFVLGAGAIVAGLACNVLASGVALIGAALAALATPIGMAVALLVGGITLSVVAARQLSPAFKSEFDAIVAAMSAMDFKTAWEIMNLNLAIALVQMGQAINGFFSGIGTMAQSVGVSIYNGIVGGFDSLTTYITDWADFISVVWQTLTDDFAALAVGPIGILGDALGILSKTEGDKAKGLDEARQAGRDLRARSDARQAALEERRKQRGGGPSSPASAADDPYEGTLKNLRDDLSRAKAKLNPKEAETASDKSSAKRSEYRQPGFIPPGTSAAQAGGGFGAMLATFSAGISGQIGIGPELNVAKETADNTKRTADGIEQIINAGDFGKGGVKAFDPAAVQTAIAATQRDMTAPVSGGDKELISVSEKTAAASERQVALLDRIARSIESGGMAFA
jgi:TP901 family phage tail tape measure protein